MRVAIVQNLLAGVGEFSGELVVRLLRERGYEVAEFASRRSEIARLIATRPDVLVAAGGDGTIAKAAIALAGSQIPLAVLPTGTANNIARSLGVTGTVRSIIQALPTARRVRLDVGLATAPWGRRHFVEAAGIGFLGRTLRAALTRRGRLARLLQNAGKSPEERLLGAMSGMARLLRRHPARYYGVVADGEDLSGTYVTAVAMNIRAIGSRLVLAPNADHGDGLLDLVLVRPADREALAEYIESGGVSGERPEPPVVSRRVIQTTISWTAEGHVDDKPWPRDAALGRKGEPRVRLGIGAATEVLVPDLPAD